MNSLLALSAATLLSAPALALQPQNCAPSLDINATAPNAGSDPFLAFEALGETAYFTADDGLAGQELWRWDIANGAVRISDLNGPADGAFGRPHVLWTTGRPLVYFVGDDGTSGREPYVSDGTLAGTHLLLDILPGAGNSQATDFTSVGNHVFFVAKTILGERLFITNGSPLGTSEVAATGGPNFPRALARFGDRLLFSAYTVATGDELWISNGTSAGTGMVLDLNPGSNASLPDEFVQLGDVAVFAATRAGVGRELFVTDGTAAGTQLLRDFYPGGPWGYPSGLVRWRGEAYFTARTPTYGYELWKTDGTAAGTQLVVDLMPGPADANIGALTPAGDMLYFSGSAPGAFQVVWQLDAAGGLTQLSSQPLAHGVGKGALLPAEGGVFFDGWSSSTGRELFFASESGTGIACDVWSGSQDSTPADLVAVGEHLLFKAEAPGTGVELHVRALNGPLVVDLGFGGPTLTLEVGAPQLGTTVGLRVAGNAPGHVGLLVYSPVTGPTSTLVKSGAANWLNPSYPVVVSVFTAPTLETGFPLPAGPALVGVRAHVQAFGYTPGLALLDASNGVAVKFGS